MSVSIKVLNNNYTKEFFNDIYRRVLIFGVEKKQGGPYDGQTHNNLWKPRINLWKDYCFYYGLPDCLYPYIKDKTLPQVCDYTFLKKYVKKFRDSNRAVKNFKHNVHPDLRCFISGVRFFQLYNSNEPECRVFQQKIQDAIELILQSKTYNFGLGLKIAKRQFAEEF